MRFDLHQYTIYNSGNDAIHFTPWRPMFLSQNRETRFVEGCYPQEAHAKLVRTHIHARAHAQVLLCYRGP